MRLSIICALSLVLSGCMTEKIVDIQTTKQWEGHFFTKQQVYEKIENMNLEKNESVWIISNETLFRILENYKSKV